VLVCYLDDSGTDPQNRILTVAGYAGAGEQWAAFEAAVEPVFAKYEVRVLHARELEAGDGDFKGWTVLRKQAFVAEVCLKLSKHVPLGVSMSVLKEAFAERAKERGRRRTVTPYTFCTNVILDWILTDVRVGRVANTDGVAFAIEAGNRHNEEAKLNFEAVVRQHDLGGIVKSVDFVDKGSCRAIQVADLFAFYSRRHGAAMEAASPEERAEAVKSPGTMLNIITESIPHRAFVATDFGPNAQGARFLSEGLDG